MLSHSQIPTISTTSGGRLKTSKIFLTKHLNIVAKTNDSKLNLGNNVRFKKEF